MLEPELKPGDRVVYPNQGVCRVTGEAEKEIAGQRLTFLTMSREDDGATVMVPKSKVTAIGVRKVAGTTDVQKVFRYLAEPLKGPELDWKIRARTHIDKMAAGGILGIAEVVKGLVTLSELRPLPTKERELYDNARHLLVSELAVAMGVDEVSAEDAVDFVLFPPGVERKKPEVKVAAAPAGEEETALPLEAGVEELEEIHAPEQSAEEAEVSEEPEAASEEQPPARKTARKAKAKPARPGKAAKPKAKGKAAAAGSKAKKKGKK